MLLVTTEARCLLRLAEQLPRRRPVLVVYELLRIAADPLELLLLVLEQEVAYLSAGLERLLELRILLDPLLCLLLCIADGGFWPVDETGISALAVCMIRPHGAAVVTAVARKGRGRPGVEGELRSAGKVSSTVRRRFLAGQVQKQILCHLRECGDAVAKMIL